MQRFLIVTDEVMGCEDIINLLLAGSLTIFMNEDMQGEMNNSFNTDRLLKHLHCIVQTCCNAHSLG